MSLNVKVKGQGHHGKRHFSALLAAWVRFMFGKTSLASSKCFIYLFTYLLSSSSTFLRYMNIWLCNVLYKFHVDTMEFFKLSIAWYHAVQPVSLQTVQSYIRWQFHCTTGMFVIRFDAVKAQLVDFSVLVSWSKRTSADKERLWRRHQIPWHLILERLCSIIFMLAEPNRATCITEGRTRNAVTAYSL